MFSLSRSLAACLVAGVTASIGQALEPFRTYDNFNGPAIDARRWPGVADRTREIAGKRLHLTAIDYGLTNFNISYVSANWTQNLLNPTLINAIRATITIGAIDASYCSANPEVSDPRARIYGAFFNAGSPTPGSQFNDVTAQVRLIRYADTSDAPNVARVEGIVFLCNEAACLDVATLGSVDMGVALPGQPTTVQLQWDKPRHRFLFARDGGAAMPVPYTVSDTSPPGSPNVHIGLRNAVANCTLPPRPYAYVDATFDNVQVNESAVPTLFGDGLAMTAGGK